MFSFVDIPDDQSETFEINMKWLIAIYIHSFQLCMCHYYLILIASGHSICWLQLRLVDIIGTAYAVYNPCQDTNNPQ